MAWCHFAPFHFAPQCHFAPTYNVPFCPRVYVWKKSHYVNYNIARCSIKWCENANNRYIIIFNHMQRFYYLMCQNTWCRNASEFIYQKGEISFLWDIKTLPYYCKFDFHACRWTGRWQKSSGLQNRPTPCMFFSKHPVFHFAPMFHFAPTYIYVNQMCSHEENDWFVKFTRSCWYIVSTHRGRVTHICVGNLTIIGSDNGLSPGRRQAIAWTNDG